MGFNLFESTNEGNKVIPMKLEILQGQSPVRANEAISRQISTGAEVHPEKMPHPEASAVGPRQAEIQSYKWKGYEIRSTAGRRQCS
jgi:hypothetical protein